MTRYRVIRFFAGSYQNSRVPFRTSVKVLLEEPVIHRHQASINHLASAARIFSGISCATQFCNVRMCTLPPLHHAARVTFIRLPRAHIVSCAQNDVGLKSPNLSRVRALHQILSMIFSRTFMMNHVLLLELEIFGLALDLEETSLYHCEGSLISENAPRFFGCYAITSQMVGTSKPDWPQSLHLLDSLYPSDAANLSVKVLSYGHLRRVISTVALRLLNSHVSDFHLTIPTYCQTKRVRSLFELIQCVESSQRSVFVRRTTSLSTLDP
ncbi:hypothetical protein F5050DRAFT_608496 [Lentinula boryana]|uniref:Uncharacterized protein n=1 Tax=Lentinula boryana TaxID=40481 RepID=A0ABQ8Q627_9AGAR|nr:hypothetical protein F5050DRAFT_608496 [Lentinula boryana]